MTERAAVLVAADTGGTFTDVVATSDGHVAVAKVLSTPGDPSEAVRVGIAQALDALSRERAHTLVHGTTVATNALLEGEGAETWFVTNHGFTDLLAIGRQERSELYALQPQPRPTLVPPERCIAVEGRRGPLGESWEPFEPGPLRATLESLDDARRSWAICLLHSYADGSDERAVASVIRRVRPEDSVSISSEILPVFREVERASTTVANAFVSPVMDAYLERLEPTADRVFIMSSSGGRRSLGEIRRLPIDTALSGPAGGVVAALHAARTCGFDAVISFDMGGTSTDVALCDGALPVRHDGRVGGFPIHVPMLDIHTVGAGGGSIASVDETGALHVGPASAGSDPGPACYGRGTDATVTDANVVLGRLPEDTRLGGTMVLDRGRAEATIDRLAQASGLSRARTAEGIIAIAVEKMARAVRVVSVERGRDPRDLPLCCFGGAGGLHACALAERLGIRTVLLPPHPGLASAFGMLRGAPVTERSRTVLGLDAEAMRRAVEETRQEATSALGQAATATEVTYDARYRGQSYELGVVAESVEGVSDAFRNAHRARFGFTVDEPVEIVTVHVRAEAEAPALTLTGDGAFADDAPGDEREQRHAGGDTPIHPRSHVQRDPVEGPAILEEMSATTWVAAGWRAKAGPSGHIILTTERNDR